MVNDRSVEQLLVQANPVLEPEELRLSSDEVDARCASILERRGVMQTQTPTRTPGGTPAPRRWRKPALAFVISLLVILIAAGGVALLIGGGDSDVTEPTPTTQAPVPTTTPTTVPEAEGDGVITAPAYAEVPTVFTGTVEYYEHDPALGDPGWQATVEIVWAGPLAYQAEVLAESGDALPLLGPGTIHFGDHLQNWINEPDDLGPWPSGRSIEPFRHLFFDGEGPDAWDDICRTGHTVVGPEIIAGQSTTHITCSSTLEDYELWIDESTGIVMKLVGPLSVGDLSPTLDRDGRFEFVDIDFGPVTTPDPQQVTASDEVFPPFHMVQEITTEMGTDTVEIWYLDSGTAKREIVDSTNESMVGTFNLVEGGYIRGCLTAENEPGCEVASLSDAPDFDFATIIGHIPAELMEANCTELPEDSVAGRSARHFVCDIAFEHVGFWRVGAVGQPSSDHWYDVATGLRVRYADDYVSAVATKLVVNPVFPSGVFGFNEPDFADPVGIPHPVEIGEIAPLWSGPLIGGGEFQVSAYRVSEDSPAGGVHLVVFDWLPGCGDHCFGSLQIMQRLHDEYADSSDIKFVTVSEDIESETARVLERLSIDVPTVYCWNDPDTVTHDQYSACTTPEPGIDPMHAQPAWLWRPVGSVTVVDQTGRVIGLFDMVPGDEASLEALVADIAGTNP